MTTDRYQAYNWLPLRRRQIGWAHLKRDLQALAEGGGESTSIGEGLLEQRREVVHLWHQLGRAEISLSVFQQQMIPIQKRIKELLYAGAAR